MTPEEKLQELISGSDNIVFLAEPACQRSPAFRISAARTACTIRNTTIRRRKF